MKNVPLQALYGFYLSADLGSFKLAAESLNITPGAMSQQIRLLEERLNVTLFERQHRKVVLTAEGSALMPYVRQGFESIENGLNQISEDPDPNSLSISTLTSFAQHWLVPRLGGFADLESSLAIKLMTSMDLASFSQNSIDLCIRFGRGQYDGLESRLLMHDYLYPVCHPLYLDKFEISTLQDLAKVKLIEDSRPDMNWQLWLELVGEVEDRSQFKPSIQLDGVHMVLEGALAVQGVALVRHSVAWKYLEQGLLVKLFDHEVKSRYSYYACAPPSYFKRPKVSLFCDWLVRESDEFVEQSRDADSRED